MADTYSGAVCKGLSWTYDSWGNRTAQNVTSGTCGQSQLTINTNNDLASRVVAEQQGSTWAVGYIYLNGALTAQYANSTTYFVHKDHLGSARLITAMNQSTYDSIDYLPFGEQVAGGTGTTHKFTGYERDAESGLDNAQARYSGSSLGRFMSPDPYNAGANPTNPQSWNMYSYVMNRPVMSTDPTGLDPCEDNPTCTPGTGNGSGYGYFPEPVGIVILPQPGGGDDCDTNPTLTGCSTRPDLAPPTGCLTVFCDPIHPLIPPLPRPPWMPPLRPEVQQKYNQCIANFKDSMLGKAVAFGSVLSFYDDVKGTAENWAEAFAVKGAIVGSFFNGANYAAGGISPVTSALKPVVGTLGGIGISAATITDFSARSLCLAGSMPLTLPSSATGWE